MDKLSEDLNQGQSDFDNQVDESRVNDVKLKQRLSEIRSENQSLRTLIESILRRFILHDMNAPLPSSIFDEILTICRESSPDCRPLLDELDKINLSSRHKAICLFIKENKHNPRLLWFYSGSTGEAAFRATKSQIKQKLQKAASSSQEIQSLLKCFNLERGCPEKPMPNVESGGKNK